MKNLNFAITMLIAVILTSCNQPGTRNEQIIFNKEGRSTLLFDFNWKFHRGDIDGAEVSEFDDAAWRHLDLPHDWSIEDLPGTESPMDETAIGGINVGYTLGGTGWYRKSFYVPAKMEGKSVRILFEGIYMNADIWLNGQHLGNHPYGYTSFWYDIADKLNYGADNLIAVEVKNEGENSRWYSGSGIYRHVWLTITNPVNVAQWGTYITTPVVSSENATVLVKTTLNNDSEAALEVAIVTKIVDPDGTMIGQK